ncbi:MAG TPA: hypothetical protein VFP68_17955 [Burkholderiaceae bacterium]|nr:hypothetical protein [Burkholderiaceae bacterium]
MKKFVAALGALTFGAGANAGTLAQGADVSYAILSDANVLMSSGNLALAHFTKCQPLKGESVAVLETRAGVDGMAGANAAHVVVTEGVCKGTEGWVALARLEKAAVPVGHAPEHTEDMNVYGD